MYTWCCCRREALVGPEYGAFGGWFADLDIAYLRDGGMWRGPVVWAETHVGRSVTGRGRGLRLVLPGSAGLSPDGEVDARFFAEPERNKLTSPYETHTHTDAQRDKNAKTLTVSTVALAGSSG